MPQEIKVSQENEKHFNFTPVRRAILQENWSHTLDLRQNAKNKPMCTSMTSLLHIKGIVHII